MLCIYSYNLRKHISSLGSILKDLQKVNYYEKRRGHWPVLYNSVKEIGLELQFLKFVGLELSNH